MVHVSSRIDAIRQRMAEEQVEALYIQSPTNRRYVSGFTGSAGAVVIGLHDVWLLVDFRYVDQAKVQAPQCTLIHVDEQLESLASLLKEARLHRVGFEAEHITVQAHKALEAKIEAVEWVATDKWIEKVRGIKDAAELAAMQQAIDLADNAFIHILDYMTPGRTEKEIALELEFFLRRAGAERIAFASIVASGPNGALPHAVPTDRSLRAGDLVTLDFGCVVEGYCSDITRTVAIRTADERSRELYDLVLRAQQAGVEAVRPGRIGKDVDAVARQLIADAGYGDYFGHGLGHGIGLDVHEEYPRLSKRGEVELQPGMVCSVEPGIYIPDWGGIRIEDLVVVQADGCRVLTKSDKTLLIV